MPHRASFASLVCVCLLACGGSDDSAGAADAGAAGRGTAGEPSGIDASVPAPAGSSGEAGRSQASQGGAGGRRGPGRRGNNGGAGGTAAQSGSGGTRTAGSAAVSGSGGQPSTTLPAAGSGATNTPPDPALDKVCAPEVSIQVDDRSGAGAGFTRAIPDPEALLLDTARTLCRILYRKPNEPRTPRSILLHVYDFDGVANAGGTTINLSTRHLANYQDEALTEEITGVLVHEATHLYQYNDGPGGLIEGVADFVRIEAGHHSLRRRVPGGNWDDGYTTTGFFLSWLDDHFADFGYRLNLALTRDDSAPWSEQAFVDLTGQTVDALWQDYQRSL